MNSLDAITLKAFLTALNRLDNSLPADIQNQLNEIAETFPSDVSKLHALARSYSSLEQEYMDARMALQGSDGERLRFVVPESDNSAQISDEDIISFAVEILNAEDSVNLTKKKAQESGILGQLLFRLPTNKRRRLSEFYGALPATRPYPGEEAIRQEVGEQLALKILNEGR
ncbi:MAG TPA: hypothetical protein V6D48_05240 [Oculatellaceae cyanobacterium]